MSLFVQDNLAEHVEDEKIDLGVLWVVNDGPRRLKLIYRQGSPLSQRALRFVEQRLQAANESSLRQRLRDVGASDRLLFHSERQAIRVSSTETMLSTLEFFLIKYQICQVEKLQSFLMLMRLV